MKKALCFAFFCFLISYPLSLVHELGHCFVLRYYGVRVERLVVGAVISTDIVQFDGTKLAVGILPFGGTTTPESGRRGLHRLLSPFQEAAVYVAGPCADFILALILLFWLRFTPTTRDAFRKHPWKIRQPAALPLSFILALWSIGSGVLNLVPVGYSDGTGVLDVSLPKFEISSSGAALLLGFGLITTWSLLILPFLNNFKLFVRGGKKN